MKNSLVLVLILVLAAALCPFAAAPLGRLRPLLSPAAQTQSGEVTLLRSADGRRETMRTDDYLLGVLAAEADPQMESEALQALCVACRSYTLFWLNEGKALSDDPDVCQGYWDDDRRRREWGDAYDSRMQRLRRALDAAGEETLLWHGAPILAAYHALSPGKTESAAVVWGRDLPYLQPVHADGDVLSPKAEQTIVMSKAAFYEAAEKLDGTNLQTTGRTPVGKSVVTESGFVRRIRIGDRACRGNDVRAAFALPSAFFTLKQTKDGFSFTVRGIGHGVGMSLNSADFMARQGSDHKEILAHFYPGATLAGVAEDAPEP